ncbi:MAG: Patatin [Pseudonocardiales bacterium]|nr:Patatin [Pseudonocardiales bacterium]
MPSPHPVMARPAAAPRGRTAFVLSGGAAHAAVQVGMLQALTDAGIEPDLLVGASAGALNAVAFAADPTQHGVDRLATAWRDVRRRDIFPLGLSGLLLGAVGRRDHLVSNRGLRKLIYRFAGIGRLEDAQLPVHVLATDLRTGEPVVLSRGDVAPALLASTAIPGLFPPIESSGRTLIDGGVAADTPVAQAEALGATTIYVLPSYGTDLAAARPRSAAAVGLRSVGQLLGHVGADKIAAARRATVHLLPAPPTSAVSPFDFPGSVRLIDEATRLATSWLQHDQAAVLSPAVGL